MKTFTGLVLLVALLLAGIGAGMLPALPASFNPALPAPQIISIDDSAPPCYIACWPPPCDCNPNC